MNGQQLQDFTEELVDDSIDDTLFLILLNTAKDKLEAERQWAYLLAVDATQSASAGDTYLSMKALPADFAEDVRVLIDTQELLPIPFEQRILYKDSPNYYYIDLANSNFAVTRVGTGGIINLIYKKYSPALTVATSPLFPERFHPILGYDVAAVYLSGVDIDDIASSQTAAHRMASLELRRAMAGWDANFRLRSMNGRAGIRNNNIQPFNQTLSLM